MARKGNFVARQALALAFAAGALTGAVSTLALRRRRHDGSMPPEGVGGPFMGGDVAGPLGESRVPPLGGRFDAPSHASVSMSAAKQS